MVNVTSEKYFFSHTAAPGLVRDKIGQSRIPSSLHTAIIEQWHLPESLG